MHFLWRKKILKQFAWKRQESLFPLSLWNYYYCSSIKNFFLRFLYHMGSTPILLSHKNRQFQLIDNLKKRFLPFIPPYYPTANRPGDRICSLNLHVLLFYSIPSIPNKYKNIWPYPYCSKRWQFEVKKFEPNNIYTETKYFKHQMKLSLLTTFQGYLCIFQEY